MALDLIDRGTDPLLVNPLPRTMSGDSIPEPGSIASMMESAGFDPSYEPQRKFPRQPVPASGFDDTVPKMGPVGDLWQLDPDPTGGLTVKYGKDPNNHTPTTNNSIVSLNVGGKMMSYEQLLKTENGKSLIELASRKRNGVKRDFFDAMNPLSWGPEKLPFVSMFATVGKSFTTAREVSNTFEKMQKGEAVSDEELVNASLYINSEREKSDGTWGATVGDIISQAPGFMTEFWLSGNILGAARKGISSMIAKGGSGGAAKVLSHTGLTRATKILADETAEDAVKSTVTEYAKKMLGDTTAGNMVKAATETMNNAEVRKDIVSKVADVIQNSIVKSSPVTGAGEWSNAVVRKVAEERAAQAVTGALTRQSTSSAVQRAVRATGKSLADGVSRGLLDAGMWGTEESSVLFTAQSSAGKALADAANVFFVEAPLKGAELLLANRAISAPISAALGGTVGAQELAIRQAAYMNNDDELMDKAHAIGLGLDLLEYVSENTGRGLKSIVRAGLIKGAPSLVKPAARAAGEINLSNAALDIVSGPSGKTVKGVKLSGLLEEGHGAEVGGIINRFVNRVLGSTDDTKANVLSDRFTAVSRELENRGIGVGNKAALEATVRAGSVQPGLDTAVAEVIGSDVAGFTENALKNAYKVRAENMKLRCFAQYWAADKMAEYGIGPKAAMRLFEQMGYDGIAGEMFEERYSDVVGALFGLDAEKDHSFKARMRNALEGLFPGWDQLTAEAVGFAMPMVARAGTMRALEKIGGGGRYAKYRENAALERDATRHGIIGEWKWGDALAGYNRSVESEQAKLDQAVADRAKKLSEKPAGADEQWDRQNLGELDETIAKATRAVSRLKDYHSAFVQSLTEDQKKAGDSATVYYAPLSIEDAELPDEEYNRRLIPTQDQARRSFSAARTLVGNSADMAQILAQFQLRDTSEAKTFFRKTSHWLVKAAGALVTGDPGMMSINPAQWNGADVGLSESVQENLKRTYMTAYADQLRALQNEAADAASGNTHEADTATAHARALEIVRPKAEQIMAAHLAANQALMFSDSDMRDVAMADVAAERGYVTDVKAREFYDPSTKERVTFADFVSRVESEATAQGKKSPIEERRAQLAASAFDTFASGALGQGRVKFARMRDSAHPMVDVVDIPKTLPTYQYAVLASLMKAMPGMRHVLRVQEVNPDVSLDDQMGGPATDQRWFDSVFESLVPGGVVMADTLQSALDNADKADPVVLEQIARDLNFQYDGTEAGLAQRNRSIIELAVLSKALADPNVRTYSREAFDSEDPGASEFSDFTTVRRNEDGTYRYTRADGRSAVAATVEELDVEMEKAGWSRTNPRVVFTSAQMLQSSDAMSMISALGLKRRLQAETKRVSKDIRHADPLFRVGPDGKRVCTTVDEADRLRDREASYAAWYERNSHQRRPELYLTAEQERKLHEAKTGVERASILGQGEAMMKECENAWYARNDDVDGYVTVAHRVLARNGVSCPGSKADLQAGMLNPELRGKYLVSIGTTRALRGTANIYVPINHETAQDYKSAILNSVCVDAFFRNRSVIADVFDSYIRNFMDAVAKLAKQEEDRVRADNPFLADNLRDFADATCAHEENQTRKITPQTFALFTSAFVLHQTDYEDNGAKSRLGDYAPAIKAIAESVRKLPSFQNYLAAVDMVFGGSGFSAARLAAQEGSAATGVSRLYSLFAPPTSKTLLDALKKAAPGGDVFKFLEHVGEGTVRAKKAARQRAKAASTKASAQRKAASENAKVMATLQQAIADSIVDEKDVESVVEKASRAAARKIPVEAPVASPSPKSEPKAAESPKKAAERESEDDRIARLQEELAERAERAMMQRLSTQADIDAGTASQETVEANQSAKDEEDLIRDVLARAEEQAKADQRELDDAFGKDDVVEATEEDDETEVTEEDDWGSDSEDLAFYAPDRTVESDESGTKPQVIRDRNEMTPSEVRATVAVVAYSLRETRGSDPSVDEFGKFIRDMVPGIRDIDYEAFVTAFKQMDDKARKSEFDDVWTWDSDEVEEGILPDGVENFNDKSVSILTNKALGNFLAFAQMVNPQTGRSLQGFLEDSRNTIMRSIASPVVSGDALEALRFADRLFNPRANLASSATVRDAYFADMLDRFVKGENSRDIARYIRALTQTDKPVSRKVAWIFSYLAALPKAARRQMTQLISSSAPSSPVHVRTYRHADGTVTFVTEPKVGNSSRLSTPAVASMFTRFNGQTAEQVKAAADSLRDAAWDMKEDFDTSEGDVLATRFNAMANLFASQFGEDSPIVSVLSSGSVIEYVRSMKYADSVVSNMGLDKETGVPYMVKTVVDGLYALADLAGKGKVTVPMAEQMGVRIAISGDPRNGGYGLPTNSSRRTDQITTIFRAYEAVLPQTVMTAEVDPERTNKPASKVAITMRGIEPALQVFMDRTDERGFRNVCEEWFPEFKAMSEFDKQRIMGRCRQGMKWPTAKLNGIVAKSLSKSALAGETYLGCQTAYDLAKNLRRSEGETDAQYKARREEVSKTFGSHGYRITAGFRDDNVFYVPVFSGDHSSSILLSVPLMKEFQDKNYTYEAAAREVSKWIGLDLLGVDAKRSATTSLEAPGVGFVGFKHNPDGSIAMRKKASLDQVSYGMTEFRGIPVVWKDDILSGDGKNRHIGGHYVREKGIIELSEKNLKLTFERKGFDHPAYGKPLPAGVIENEEDMLRFVLLRETSHHLRPNRPANVPYADWEDEMNQYAIDQTMEPVTGECRVNIVWNRDGGKNESMLGTTLATGYGMKQLKMCAKDPKSSTLKFHAMNVSNTGRYGAVLSLIKSLCTAMDENAETTTGDLCEWTPTRALMDFIRRQRSSDSDRSTSIISDFDSIKLSLANSKMMGVMTKNEKGEDELVPLMEYVFDRVKNAGKLKDSYSGADLDDLVGDINWTDLAIPKRSNPKARLSEILDGVRLDRVDGLNGEAYSLSYADNDLMGFQVANVSHPSRTPSEPGRTPRNHVVDAFAIANVLDRGWNADESAGIRCFNNLKNVTTNLQDLIASWGRLAMSAATRPETAQFLLKYNEDAQEAKKRGEPPNGRFMKDILARALSTHLRKNLMPVPMNGVDAALFSNMSWIGDDGKVRTQSKSKMFYDTLQGSRTIRRSMREFMRGHRRVAICNANCTDPSFRYGMYLDKSVSDLKTVFAKELGKWSFTTNGDDFKDAVEILETAFTELRDLESRITSEEKEGKSDSLQSALDLRKRIASCFIDAYGNDLSLKKRTFTVKTRDADGNVTRTESSADWYAEVSYEDLFTDLVVDNEGKMTFDRTAVYESMRHDKDGRARVYLGGTMMGLPRTPSYNGSQWNQVVRAGLPISAQKSSDESGKTADDAKAGYDAIVAPDPYTLKILGCDHDGDKTKLYMLSAASPCASVNGKRAKARQAGNLYVTPAELDNHDSMLERRRVRDGKQFKLLEWQLTDDAKVRMSNSFVRALFDTSRALPLVDNSDAEVPFFNASIADGCVAPETKASLLPKKMWEDLFTKNPKAILPKLLDPKSGKTVGDPKTAAAIGDGSQNAADARAIVVSLASSLHVAFASGLFANTLFHQKSADRESAKAWLDFMHHLDGFSNMTFDDIKEQVCSRLGVTSGMMDTIVADMINGGLSGDLHRLPRTDEEFAKAFAFYTKQIVEKGARHYMNRATNKADYAMQKYLADTFGGEGGEITSDGLATRFGLVYDRKARRYVRNADPKAPVTVFTQFTDSILSYASEYAAKFSVGRGDAAAACSEAINMLVRNGSRKFSDALGYAAYGVSHKDELVKTAKEFVDWAVTISELRRAKSFARSVNFLTADPTALNADGVAKGRERGWENIMISRKDGFPRWSDRAMSISAPMRNRLLSMHVATMKAYSLSPDALTVQSYGNRAAESFFDDFDFISAGLGNMPKADAAEMADLAFRFAGAETLAKGDCKKLEANSQMVGLAVAAFRTVRKVRGSKITSDNALDVLEAIAKGSADYRRGTSRRNAPLDMRRGIEDMFELMYRMADVSTVRDENPIFQYFSEANDSGPRSYSNVEYYGDSEIFDEIEIPGRTRDPGLGRLTVAFRGITEGQMADVRKLYDRVVVDGELDPDGKFGKTLYDAYSKGNGHTKPLMNTLVISKVNLKKITARGHSPYAKELWPLVKEMESVLDALEPVLGKDVEITPSMLFGQILPLHAALTNRVDRVPDSRSSSTVTVMGDTYARWAAELADLESGSKSAKRIIRMMSAVNWAPVNVAFEKESGSYGRPVVHLTPEEFAKRVDSIKDQFSKQNDPTVAAVQASGLGKMRKRLHVQGQQLVNPEGRYLIDVFGNNGLFRSALGVLRSSSVDAMDEWEDTMNGVEDNLPSKGDIDPTVKSVADRLGAVIAETEGAKVEYSGGDSFVVRIRLTGKKAEAAKAGGVDAAVRVTLTDSILSDREAKIEYAESPAAHASVAATRSANGEKVTANDVAREVSKMTDDEKVKFAEDFGPAGLSRGAKGDWAVPLKALGVLCGDIVINRSDADDPKVVYHEYFHSVVRMLRSLGAFSDEDVKVLRHSKRIGRDRRDAGWFNEEKAAIAFAKYVNGAEEADDEKGVFRKLFDTVRSLYRSLMTAGMKSEDFANPMAQSPLAAMVLLGKTDFDAPNPEIIEPSVKEAADAVVNGTDFTGLADEDLLMEASADAVQGTYDGGLMAELMRRRDMYEKEGNAMAVTAFEVAMDQMPDPVTGESAINADFMAKDRRKKKPGDEAVEIAFPKSAPGDLPPFNVFSRAVGNAIRNRMTKTGYSPADMSVLNGLAKAAPLELRGLELAAAEEAVQKVAAVYGVQLSNKSQKFRDLVFRALYEVNSGAKSYKRTDGRATGPYAGSSVSVTSSDLAAAILVSCGTTPDMLAQSVLRDLRPYAKKYEGTEMFEIIANCAKAVMTLQKYDPSGLCESRGDEIQEEIHKIEAGLRGGTSADGKRENYRLGTTGKSSNPYNDHNVGRYGNFVDRNGDGNPDFQIVIRRTLDTLYTALAGMKFYRELDFEPGEGGNVTVPGNTPAPNSPDETAATLGVDARRILDADAVEFYDQPAFVANNVESYLQSLMGHTFGKVDPGELMMSAANRHAGYVRRLVNAENWLAALLGQNVLPGQDLHEAELVDGKFAMEHGSVVAKAGGKNVRFRLYENRRTKVSLTEDEHRLVDMVLKADKAYYQGARNVLTGVDGIRFTTLDPRKEDYYSRENVKKRFESDTEHSEIDRALTRLDLQLPAFMADRIRERFVTALCEALNEAHSTGRLEESPQKFNDFVLGELEHRGILCAHQAYDTGLAMHARDYGALVFPVDELEQMFQSSTAKEKLLKARANVPGIEKMLSREERIRPLHQVYREMCSFVKENPWLTEGDGQFFNNFGTPLAFVRGSGVFMYNANRRARGTVKSAAEKLTAEEETFRNLMNGAYADPDKVKSVDAATNDQLRFVAALFGTYEKDAASLLAAIKQGRYAFGSEGSRKTGLTLTADSTTRDVCLAIYNRLVEAAWKENGDPVLERLGGQTVQNLIAMYEANREKDQSLTGGVGLTDEAVYRMNGILPANHQLGHAIRNQMEGVTNALMFRSTLVNMLMTPDMDGHPVMYADPNSVAAEASGIPDQVWGTIARWWANCNGMRYDETKSGIANAQEVYKKVKDLFGSSGSKTISYNGKAVEYGQLKAEDIDSKSVSEILAQKSDRGELLNRLAGGYALGYAKHLMQSSRNFGSTAQRAVIHRALSYSKSLSVSFSFFFPLATKYESPIGAVGAMAMMGSNWNPEVARQNPELFSAIQKIFGGDGWITKDFLGFRDVLKMMDSNDPFLSELIGWASALGVSLSDSLINPIEPQRSILQKDMANLREMVRDRMGLGAARKFDAVSKLLLTRSGDKAFTYALNATKLATVAQMCMKLRHEAEKKGVAFDPVRDLKRYAGYINAEIGGIDPLKYAWAHPMNRGIMNMLMFSWEWTRGAWEAGGGGAIEDFLFGGHNVTAEERKYMIGRWARMFGAVMIGVPLMFQMLVKALAVAMGHDDDDEKWFTWQNEDKACWTAFDLTPLMKAMTERFPRVAQWKKEHPVAGSLLPMYTGSDRANRKYGSMDEEGNTNGRHYYMHFGKQGWEFFRWFSDPSGQFFSKLSMPTQRMLEGVFGRSLSWMDHELPWSDMSFAERWLNPSLDSATANMVKAFLPFTLSGFTDKGDAGLLSAFGPIQMGSSATATQDKMVKVLKAWAFNDRRGYQPANRISGKYEPAIANLNSSVGALVKEAMVNGARPADALRLVSSSVGRLTASLYGELMDSLPQKPDGDFDAEKVAKLVRAINRLGRKRKNVIEAMEKRFKDRKLKPDMNLLRRWGTILRAQMSDPYGTMEGV